MSQSTFVSRPRCLAYAWLLYSWLWWPPAPPRTSWATVLMSTTRERDTVRLLVNNHLDTHTFQFDLSRVRVVAAIASTATDAPPTTNSMWSSALSKIQRGTTATRRESRSPVWTGLLEAARLSKLRMLSTKECKKEGFTFNSTYNL